MSIPFRQAPFKTANGIHARSLDEWFGDIINVKEMGATGDGTTNDAPSIQAAFDLAFHNSGGETGSPVTGVPHGEDEKRRNRPVYFPAGIYSCDSTLNLTRVVGGKIYGSGPGPTYLSFDGSVVFGGDYIPLLHINGAVNLHMESMELKMSSDAGISTDANNGVLLLDWDGVAGATGGGGLRFNRFDNMRMLGGEYTVVIAESGYEGNNNLFISTVVNGNPTHGEIGIDVRGPAALNNSMIGGGVGNYQSGVAGVRCPVGGGSFHSQGTANTGNLCDYLMESGHVMHLCQGRTESDGLFRLESGTVVAQCWQTTDAVDLAIINGGKAIIECGWFGNSSGAAQIIGTGGELYISACHFNAGIASTPLSGYSGTIVWDLDNWQDL